MKTVSTQPPAAGEAAHTPTLGLFIPSGTIEAVPCYDDNHKLVNYRVDVYDLGGGDCFYVYGTTAADAERQARKIVGTLERGNPHTNGHAALVAALENFRDALTTPDANADCESARKKLLKLCPEYVGFLKQAAAALNAAKAT
jgi:hypothetical protein